MTTEQSPTAHLLEHNRKRSASPRLLLGLALASAVAVGGVAFAVGRMTAPAAAATFPAGNPGGGTDGFQPPGGQAQGPGGFGGFGGGLGLQGTIVSIGEDTLTLETSDGSTITVNLSDDTSYAREESADQGDLNEGDEVRVGVDVAAGSDPQSEEVDASSVTLVQP